MMTDYIPALVAIVFALAFSGLFLVLAVVLGPRRLTPGKLAPFECGSEPIGSPRVRFSVKFYQVAILFLVFDIEAAFLYPWAVQYRSLYSGAAAELALVGFVELLVFLALLVIALVYVWRKGAVGWE
jgi:NADH-quinone oxidoreductase subunit A